MQKQVFCLFKFLHLFSIYRLPDCFSIGWPMRLDHAFFFVPSTNKSNVKNAIVSPDKIKERKKREKKDEESEVIMNWLLLLQKLVSATLSITRI